MTSISHPVSSAAFHCPKEGELRIPPVRGNRLHGLLLLFSRRIKINFLRASHRLQNYSGRVSPQTLFSGGGGEGEDGVFGGRKETDSPANRK